MPGEKELVPFKPQRGGIPLPERNVDIDCDEDDDLGPPDVPVAPEVVTEAEQRRYEESKVRVPDEPLDVPPIAKRSLVTPIEVKAKTLWGFFAAMSRFVEWSGNVPIRGGVKLSFCGGNNPRLMLEAASNDIWVAAGIDVIHGGKDFQCVVPLGRAMNVIKLLAWKHATVFIGIDEHRVHIGNYSFPFVGKVDHFPKRKSLRPEQWKMALPVSSLREIEERVLCVSRKWDGDTTYVSHDSLHIDFDSKVVFATDGAVLHLLQVPSMHTEQVAITPPMDGVALPKVAVPFLIEVAEHDWVGLKISPERIMFGAEDCALVADTINKYIKGWRQVVPIYDGAWLVDTEKLIEVLEGAASINTKGVILCGDHESGSLEVSSSSIDGATFSTTLPVRTSGKVLGTFRIEINPQFLLRSVKAANSGVVRIGVNDGGYDPVTVEDENKTFKAVIMKRKSNHEREE